MNREADNTYQNGGDDFELVKDFQAGDAHAFDGIVMRHQNSVFNLCCRIVGNYDDANDCAQETFIKVYNNLKGFQSRSALSTWIYRIAVNTCRNHLASLDQRMKKRMIRLENHDGGFTTAIKDKSFSPADRLEREEQENLIMNAIDTLPRDQKILVVLRDIEGKSYGEIARITGHKEGTVKSKLARARRKLRELLEGELE